MQVLTTARAPLPHRYLACFVDMPREVLCIVTELAAGGTLKRAIACQSQLGRPFRSLSIVKWVEQLSSALSAIHAQLIIHRDIKPANIFLTKEANLKLGDFGLSRRTPHSGAVTGAMDLATTACGTPYYMSPERFQTGVGYSTPSDLWSVGCVLYEMLTLKKCFAASSFAELCAKIEQGDYRPACECSPRRPVPQQRLSKVTTALHASAHHGAPTRR